MAYQFEKEDRDYTDFASGRVFHGMPGVPAFPVRLASEIFQRCRRMLGMEGGIVLYDPCCGGAYHLCALAYLHWDNLDAVLASDVDEKAVGLARRNLALLTLEGLDQRAQAIAGMHALYGKESHAGALKSAALLREQLARHTAGHHLQTGVFRANALDSREIQEGLGGRRVHLVLTDIPYGKVSQWQVGGITGRSSPQDSDPVWQMLEALLPALSDPALVAISAAKRQKIAHERYWQLGQLKVGKRQTVFLGR